MIRLWEQPAELFLQSPGLLPLAVLAQAERPDQVLRQVARAIEQQQRQVRSNLAGCAGVLAGLKLEAALVGAILQEAVMQESTVYQAILREGRQQGLEQGLEQGRQQERLALARKLMGMGMDIDRVIKATGFSREQLESLKS